MDEIKQHMQQIKDRFAPNGVLDKKHIQQVLSEELQTLLLFRTPDQTIESIIDGFSRRNGPQLLYLGDARHVAILREAQESCNVDLSQWIGQE